MIRSMTGYAGVHQDINSGHYHFEIKSLNHRGFDIHYHSSRSLSMLEVPVRELVQKKISRGRIELFLRGDTQKNGDMAVQANPGLAQRYLDCINSLQHQLPDMGTVRLEFLLNLPGVFEIDEQVISADDAWETLHGVVETGLAGLMEMKIREGANLAKELLHGIEEIERLTREILGCREQVLTEYRQKISDRIKEWLDRVELDESRMVQELAFYADRSDIQEECVRLLSHVGQFHALLDENTADTENYTAVGRRMDFLCQEMFREANTAGAKSSSMEVVERVLHLKGQIDRLREQVQNVE